MSFVNSSGFEHSEVLEDVVPVVDYRAFRRRYFARQAFKRQAIQPHYGRDDHVPPEHPLSKARRDFRSARAALVSGFELPP